jgi:hypothetical protein
MRRFQLRFSLLFCLFLFSLGDPALAEGYGADGYYYSDAGIEAIIEANFDYEDWYSAKAIAWCESSYVPQAYNPAYDTVGLFQISYIARVHYGLTYWDVDTPAENAFWANYIQDREGWGPWACA